MTWQQKATGHRPPWLTFESAVVDVDGLTIEDVIVRCMWRPAMPPAPEKYVFRIHHGRDRILAYDIDETDVHHVSGFPGMPCNDTTVFGSHRHIWTDQG